MEPTSRRALIGSLPWVALAAACGRKPAESLAEVVVVPRPTLPRDPLDRAWDQVGLHRAALVLQDMVEPRLLAVSTAEVRVKAISDGASVAFRLEWDDAGKDDRPGPSRFCDACAVQLPTVTQPDVPAPQMGEPGRPVEITYWRASWQAVVDGRGDEIRDLEPRAAIDHYPFEAPSLRPGSEAQREMALRYAPARSVGNRMGGPRAQPVEDLVAEGPGTLGPAAASTSTGRGRRSRTGWAVLLSRRLPAGLIAGARTQVAFAVWQGSRQEAGSRKMRTPWIPLLLRAQA